MERHLVPLQAGYPFTVQNCAMINIQQAREVHVSAGRFIQREKQNLWAV